MWQTKYDLAITKNLGVGVNFWLCSEDYFLYESIHGPWIKVCFSNYAK